MASFGVARVFVGPSVVLSSVPGRAERIVSVAVEGTQFKVTLDSGQVLDSLAQGGAALNVDMPGTSGQLIRIESVQKDSGDLDGDVFLHHMLAADVSGRWQEFCPPDKTGAIWAFPLQGQWG